MIKAILFLVIVLTVSANLQTNWVKCVKEAANLANTLKTLESEI